MPAEHQRARHQPHYWHYQRPLAYKERLAMIHPEKEIAREMVKEYDQVKLEKEGAHEVCRETQAQHQHQ